MTLQSKQYNMDNPTIIRQIAQQRIEEAECLFANGHFDGAYYLAGYALELTLKAKICDCLRVPNFYKQHITGELSKAFKTHKIDNLLLFTGLHETLNTEKQTNPVLLTTWSVVTCWNENSRYNNINTCDNSKSEDFISAIKYIITWINTH